MPRLKTGIKPRSTAHCYGPLTVLPSTDSDELIQAAYEYRQTLRQVKQLYNQCRPERQSWLFKWLVKPMNLLRNARRHPLGSRQIETHLGALTARVEALSRDAKKRDLEMFEKRVKGLTASLGQARQQIQQYYQCQHETVTWAQGMMIGAIVAIAAHPAYGLFANVLAGLIIGVAGQMLMDMTDTWSIGKEYTLDSLTRSIRSGALTGIVTGIATGVIRAMM